MGRRGADRLGRQVLGRQVLGRDVREFWPTAADEIAAAHPTRGRATAQNVLFNVGRGVGGFGPLVIGWLATQYSLSVALSFLVVIWALDILVTIFMIKERKGEPLT
jgi:hypothetical protein